MSHDGANGTSSLAGSPPLTPHVQDLTGRKQRFIVGVLAGNVSQSNFYQPWLSHPPTDIEVRVLADFSVERPLAGDIDLLITHNHYRWDELAVLRQTMQSGERGVLVLADGILEFRNSWQNPTIAAGSLLQPAIAHKIATIGPAQTRWLESWGNLGCCETVGLPRLDAITAAQGWHVSIAGSTRGAVVDEGVAAGGRATETGAAVGSSKPNRPSRLLICSARTPAFSEEQWAVTLDQFQALADYLQRCPPHAQGRPVAVRWRVAERIATKLNLPAEACSSGPLAAELQPATAVITMPSTVQLEAMLHRCPVATLDFFHVPNYVPAAWQITASEHFAVVIPQMFDPCPLRQFYQENVLRDQLWCQSPASERMWALIGSMARIAGRQRQQGLPIRFPQHILPLDSSGVGERLTTSPSDWACLQPARAAWRQQAQAAKSDVWELTEVEAALARARQTADERVQLQRLVETHRQTVQTYEYNISKIQTHADFLQENLTELQARWEDTKQRLEQRNAEFGDMYARLQQLAADKLAAHEKLKEAYADAQRKQERVNELRGHYQEIRTAYEALKSRIASPNQPPAPPSS